VCPNRSGVSYRAESVQTVRIPLTTVDGLSLDTSRREVAYALGTPPPELSELAADEMLFWIWKPLDFPPVGATSY
jgi:hypothetical protein